MSKRFFGKLLSGLVVMSLVAVSLAGCGGTKEAPKPADAKPAEAKPAEAKPAASKPAEPVTLRLGHVVQTTHPMHLAAAKFAELVEQKSQGRIKVTIYPARQLGGDRELFEQVQSGSLDMAEVSAAPVGAFTPIATAYQLPFMIESYDEWLKIMKSEPAQKMLDGFSEVKVKGLAVYDAGFRNFVTLDKPVTVPADMAGKKLRVAETPLHVEIFKALGAGPTPMAYGEIYSALQNKVIDGLEMDMSAVLMEKHYEVAKNVTLSRHFTWPALLVMSEKRWNSFSDEDKKLITAAAQEAVDYNIKQVRELDESTAKELEAKGVKIVPLQNVDQFRQATKAVYDKYKNAHPLNKQFVEYVESQKK